MAKQQQPARTFVVGERVRWLNSKRIGIVRDMPKDAAEDVQRLRTTHLCVMLEKSVPWEEEQIQFWPMRQVLKEGEEPRHNPGMSFLGVEEE